MPDEPVVDNDAAAEGDAEAAAAASDAEGGNAAAEATAADVADADADADAAADAEGGDDAATAAEAKEDDVTDADAAAAAAEAEDDTAAAAAEPEPAPADVQAKEEEDEGAADNDAAEDDMLLQSVLRERSATTIQSNFRGKKDRKAQQAQQASATKIQARLRGKKDRKERKKHHESATKIQARLRGKQAKKVAAYERKRADSATAIQSRFRGKKAADAYDKQKKERHKAALKLQAQARRRLGEGKKDARQQRAKTEDFLDADTSSDEEQDVKMREASFHEEEAIRRESMIKQDSFIDSESDDASDSGDDFPRARVRTSTVKTYNGSEDEEDEAGDQESHGAKKNKNGTGAAGSLEGPTVDPPVRDGSKRSDKNKTREGRVSTATGSVAFPRLSVEEKSAGRQSLSPAMKAQGTIKGFVGLGHGLVVRDLSLNEVGHLKVALKQSIKQETKPELPSGIPWLRCAFISVEADQGKSALLQTVEDVAGGMKDSSVTEWGEPLDDHLTDVFLHVTRQPNTKVGPRQAAKTASPQIEALRKQGFKYMLALRDTPTPVARGKAGYKNSIKRLQVLCSHCDVVCICFSLTDTTFDDSSLVGVVEAFETIVRPIRKEVTSSKKKKTATARRASTGAVAGVPMTPGVIVVGCKDDERKSFFSESQGKAWRHKMAQFISSMRVHPELVQCSARTRSGVAQLLTEIVHAGMETKSKDEKCVVM